MKMVLAGMALAGFATIASAQTATDDSPSTENWWDRVGAGFFSDENMQTMRPEAEIRAMWTGLSADDQAALKARCAAMSGDGAGTSASTTEGTTGTDGNASGTAAAPNTGTSAAGSESTETGSAPGTNTGATVGTSGSGADTTVTGSTDGTENQSAGQSGTSAETGLAPSVTGPNSDQLTQVCTLVQSL